MLLTSTAFEPGQEIPSRYTCDGEDLSPPLQWTQVPRQARSLALIVDDPDAPDPRSPRMTWVHWVLFNLPPQTAGLAEGAGAAGLPEGAQQGINDWNKTRYGGPCPPVGRHRYFHKLYALDTVLSGLDTPDKAALVAAMEGHVLASAELVGTYQKRR
ncbi:MAG: YbhB/YbcL family Raf kinase inhibitor-like protein [Thiogranum sp.]|nr:YbhB/YbcL family Raf kinase inhibitor-like protein [Thiogranum sp.]